jgi:hypothetical protein
MTLRMTEFLKGWGSLIIAAIALVQPWLIGLFKKCFKRKRVEIYEAGTVEIGASNFGPTVGLFGTLNAVHGDAVVQNMSVKVVRLKDKAEHDFSWAVFRSPKFVAAGPDPSFQLCTAFVVPAASPHHFNILFWDRAIIDEAQPAVSDLMKQWSEFLQNKRQRASVDDNVDSPEFRTNAYDEFAKTPGPLKTYTALQDMFYWFPGRYSLQLEVATIHPKNKFIKKWAFKLTEQDSDRLKLNIVNVLREICAVPPFPYNFAYAKYETAPDA